MGQCVAVDEWVTPNGTRVETGGRYYMMTHESAAGSRGEGQATALFDHLTNYNAAQVAEGLMAHPARPRFQYAAAAIGQGCFATLTDITSFFPSGSTFHQAFFGMGIEELKKKTVELRRSLLDEKIKLQQENLHQLILANAAEEKVALTREQVRSKVARELFRRNMKVSHFPVDGKTGLNNAETYDHAVTLMRYVLEPERVPVSKWSLSIKTRSLTYTFADKFSVYYGMIKNTILAQLNQAKNPSCEELAEQSRNAYKTFLSSLASAAAYPTVSPIPLWFSP